MKYLAGAIVVLAGALLWGVGAAMVTSAYNLGGNRSAGEMATWGGMALAAFGCAFLIVAHKSNRPGE
jgi:hypothetical protein